MVLNWVKRLNFKQSLFTMSFNINNILKCFHQLKQLNKINKYPYTGKRKPFQMKFPIPAILLDPFLPPLLFYSPPPAPRKSTFYLWIWKYADFKQNNIYFQWEQHPLIYGECTFYLLFACVWEKDHPKYTIWPPWTKCMANTISSSTMYEVFAIVWWQVMTMPLEAIFGCVFFNENLNYSVH